MRMTMTHLQSQTVLLIGVVLLGAGSAVAAPPAVNISESSLSSGLKPEEIKQVATRITYWVEQIKNAEGNKAQQTTTDARDGLLFDFNRYGNTRYEYVYAGEAAKIVSEALKTGLGKNDPNLCLKEVNLAMAVANMPQAPIQDVLEVMVAHRNEAVRAIGWKGYQKAQKVMFTQGKKYSDLMLATMKKQAAAEKSPAVLGALFQALYIPPDRTGLVDEKVLSEAQKTAFAILQENWQRCCKEMLTSAEMTRTMIKAIGTLGRLQAMIATDDKGKTASLQMIVDAMRCASLVYDSDWTKDSGEGDDAMVCAVLLRYGEVELRRISQINSTGVEKALTDPKVTLRGVIVQEAVLNWIDDNLKKFGVKTPDYKMPESKT